MKPEECNVKIVSKHKPTMETTVEINGTRIPMVRDIRFRHGAAEMPTVIIEIIPDKTEIEINGAKVDIIADPKIWAALHPGLIPISEEFRVSMEKASPAPRPPKSFPRPIP